jgi:hypothetical protein
VCVSRGKALSSVTSGHSGSNVGSVITSSTRTGEGHLIGFRRSHLFICLLCTMLIRLILPPSSDMYEFFQDLMAWQVPTEENV